MMEPEDIEFSVDLVESAIRHLHFLDNVDNHEKLLTGEVLEHALIRYEKLWLPLANEHRSLDLFAPIDIAWLWYIHLLSPLAYRRDCRKLFKTTLTHEFKGDETIIGSINNAIELWYSKYPEQGFNTIRNGEYFKSDRNKGRLQQETSQSKLSVDLILNAENHMHFCYQVALPHFRDRKYLQNALTRYKQFLCLKRMEPDEFLTPSVDIMLIWFTHMCNPIAYANDLMKICGRLLDNNIKVRPALVDEKYLLARQKTDTLWKKVSTEGFVQPGTKLRSNESRKEIYPMTMEDLKESCVVAYKVYLTHAELIGLPTKLKYNLQMYNLCSTHTDENILRLKGNKTQMWSFSSKFTFNTVENKGLSVHLATRSKFWCYKGVTPYANGNVDLRTILENMGMMQRSLSIEIDLTASLGVELKLLVDGAVESAMPQLCDLTLKEGIFEKMTLTSKSLSKSWGNAALPQSVTKENHECFVSAHVLENQEGRQCFRSRIIHIPEMLRSGVEVFYGNKLVATSYVVGSSQLPSPTQVQWSDLSMAFDPELGERAMLIRNHKGDWGLCIARWITEALGTEGHLEVRFLKLVGTNKQQRIEVRSADIQFQSFNGNLYSGRLQINPSNNTVGENLATIWSISILYVLCAPRDPHRNILLMPKDQTPQEDVDDDPYNTCKVVREANCPFLLAAGLKTSIPNNEYVLKTHGSLSHDIYIDAQDIVVEEQKTNHKLFRRETKLFLRGDSETSVKKLKKKKSSKLREHLENMDMIEENVSLAKEPDSVLNDEPTLPNAVADPDADKKKQKAVKKRKRIKKRQSSNLDDMLSLSEDSITKDDIEETKLVKDEKGNIKVVKKMSSNLGEIPSDDSIDKELDEMKEYFEGRVENIPTLSHEQTVIIRDIAEKKIKEKIETTKQLDENLGRGEEVKVGDMKNGNTGNGNALFQLGGTDTDNRSDTSSITSETKKMRQHRLAKTREDMFPLSDDEISPISVETTHVPLKRKRSKKKKLHKATENRKGHGGEQLTEILEITGAQEDSSNI